MPRLSFLFKALTIWAAGATLAAAAAAGAAPGGQALAGRAPLEGPEQDYVRLCQGCHRADGVTPPDSVPPLRDMIGAFTHLPEGRAYLVRVPGVAQAPLDDARLAALLNWCVERFGRDQRVPGFVPFSADEVGRLRAQMLLETRSERAELLRRLRARGVLE